MNLEPVSTKLKWGVLVLVLVALPLLLMDHWSHAVPYLPWLLLAACPLMHVFGHHGKHGHNHGAGDCSAARDDDALSK